MSQRRYVVPKRDRFPWLLLLVLGATIFLFWFSPQVRKPAPVRIDYAPKR